MNGKHYKEMVAALAHDLRNPLGSIGFNAALLAQHAPDNASGDKIRAHVANIQRLVNTMSQMTDALLSAEAIDNNRLPMERRVMDVTNDVRDALQEMVQHAQHRGVKFDVHGYDGPKWAYYDSQRVRQVLINLVGNAIKYAEKGSTIKIVLTRDEDPKWVRIEVWNGGSLVPNENQAKLFERFFQGTQTHGFGGLGLWICRSIIDQHGGRIWYESKEGHNVFIFTLPHEPPSDVPSTAKLSQVDDSDDE